MICSSKYKVANAVGGKTARACDSCIRKRARWYCAADDAFLCQSCDSSVHSANSLARRHERVRLKTASLKSLDHLILPNPTHSVPSWHRGFTRKARTPRHAKSSLSFSKFLDQESIPNPIPLVPEVDVSHEDNDDDQLLYRVPIFEPFVAELCTTPTTISNEAAAGPTTTANPAHPNAGDVSGGGLFASKASMTAECEDHDDKSNLHNGFMPSDKDIAEFAADVESLLGRGLENESFGMEELGLMDCKEDNELINREYFMGNNNSCNNNGKVKLEQELQVVRRRRRRRRRREGDAEEEYSSSDDVDMSRDPPFELNFDYDDDEEEKVVVQERGERELKRSSSSSGENHEDDDCGHNGGAKEMKRRKILLLSLDYDGVITAWASHGSSPWTTGNRPDFDPDECWPDCLGRWETEVQQHTCGGGDMVSGVGGHHLGMGGDGGREARVSRYREKRRTRLFSKKIRYEVRKLNAEKRPRMKGRFVKRATFAA